MARDELGHDASARRRAVRVHVPLLLQLAAAGAARGAAGRADGGRERDDVVRRVSSVQGDGGEEGEGGRREAEGKRVKKM